MTPFRRSSLLAPTVALLVAAVACGGKKLVTPPVRHVAAAYRPECGIDTIRVKLPSDTNVVAKFTRLAVSYDATLIPEFNDCQRFATTSATSYGPLVGIYASDSLNQTIVNLRQLAASNAAARALPVAIILSYDGDYDALHIKRGFDCLYLAAGPRAGNSYRYVAWIVPAVSDADCAKARTPADLDAIAPHLDVHPRDLGHAYTVNDYPQVARWDWDRRARHQYIGIGCRERWCEIGNDGVPSPNYDDPAMPPQHRRKLQIKGWYDEELLAVKPASGAGLVPSPVFGTIAPEPGLEARTTGDYHNRWIPAARVYLTGSLAPYQTKFGFTQTQSPGDGHAYNAIAMCMSVAGSVCDFGSTAPPTGCNMEPGDTVWYARIQPAEPMAKPVYRCVTRREHPFKSLLGRIAGTVRWRWEETDHNAWIACPDGCCEVVGES